MKISLNWISDFVELPKISAKEIGQDLTHHTAEVEEVIDSGKAYEKMVIGEVKALQKHPGADRLQLVQVDIGEQTVQIVCGGQNLFEGMLVAVALPGSWVRWHGEGELVELSEAKVRGESSYGMICAGEEIGLPPDNTPDSKEVRIADLSSTRAQAGTPLAKALSKEGAVIEIDNKSLTHRPDLWGHYGIARELAAIYGKKLAPLDHFVKIPSTKGELKRVQRPGEGAATAKVHVDIQDDALCPRFSSAIMSGITIEESPAWMKARLQAVGMNAHNNIVDITNYVMLELGQPMHAYDRKVIGSDILRVRFAKNGEKLTTLDGGEQDLTAEDPLICDGKNIPVGLAGVKGGLKSGISDATNEIILESATFDPVVVRKSAVRHALRTDASQRFEKSLDPALTELALQRAIHLILELCPSAKLEGPVETVGTWKPKKITLTLDPESVCKKIGVKITSAKMTSLLRSLDFDVKAAGKKLSVTVPSHRATRDVSIPEDLVEEVARLYGYNNIAPVLPEKPLELPRENVERSMKHLTRSILSLGLGFTEVMTHSFYGKDRLEKCGLDEKDHLRVLNYLSLDQTHMRSSLTPNLLATVALNAREREMMKIFELGHTYKEVGEFMPLEEKRLTAMVALKGESFYEAKGALEAFLEAFRVTRYELKPSHKILPYAHPKKSMDLIVKGKTVGVLFTVHPSTLKAFDIPHSVSVFSVQFSDLVQTGRELQKFTPLAKFPAVPFDISVLTGRRENVAQVEKIIRSVDKEKLITSVELFDIYEGKNIPEDKKSLSFRVVLRHNERTLTDAEFQTLYASVTAALEKAGFTIRGL